MAGIFQPTIVRFESIDSTNLEAIRQARTGAGEGLCIVAREQTAGRGRLDRSWHSPKDAGLYLSIVLRPDLPLNSWPLLTLMTALAVVDALRKSCGVRADIKWPNDIYVNDRKICGILSETVDPAADTAAIVGIGINLASEVVPETLRGNATSLEEVRGCKPDGERILEELLKAFAQRYELLRSQGGDEHTIREWCANSSYAFDRRVRVSLDGESFEGVTRGLDRDGALRVRTDDEKLRVVRAGDVTAVRGAWTG